MLCEFPRTINEKFYPCGKCQPCRINRRSIWTTRLVLEQSLHSNSCFTTLTYDDEHLPKNKSLQPSDTKSFLKSIRYRFGSFRYYLIGEYGDAISKKTSKNRVRKGIDNPHYHALLFGLNLSKAQLELTWQKGRCDSGTVTHESAQYVAGYINSTRKPEELGDRHREYSRMSRNPGIGAWSPPGGSSPVDMLVNFHTTEVGSRELTKNRDVQGVVRYAKRIRPLGRYIVRKTRDRLGVPHSDPDRPHHLDNLSEKEIYELEDRRQVVADRAKQKVIKRNKL